MPGKLHNRTLYFDYGGKDLLSSCNLSAGTTSSGICDNKLLKEYLPVAKVDFLSNNDEWWGIDGVKPVTTKYVFYQLSFAS